MKANKKKNDTERNSRILRIFHGLREFGYSDLALEDLEAAFDRVEKGKIQETNILDILIMKQIGEKK